MGRVIVGRVIVGRVIVGRVNGYPPSHSGSYPVSKLQCSLSGCGLTSRVCCRGYSFPLRLECLFHNFQFSGVAFVS